MAPLTVVFRPVALADIAGAVSFFALLEEDGRIVARFLRTVDDAVLQI